MAGCRHGRPYAIDKVLRRRADIEHFVSATADLAGQGDLIPVIVPTPLSWSADLFFRTIADADQQRVPRKGLKNLPASCRCVFRSRIRM